MLIKLDTYKSNVTPDERSKINIEQNLLTTVDNILFIYNDIFQITFTNNVGGSFCVYVPTKEELKALENTLFETNKLDLTRYFYDLISVD